VTDVFSKEKRSQVMSRIRSRGNRDTELALASLLRNHHISGWRRHVSIFGRPDFSFAKARVAVFVDGCFWHSCPRCATRPANNRTFWKNKLAANHRRDRLVNRTLRAKGWKVLRIWEHALAKQNPVSKRLRQALCVS
jgi:DNA mismatch endonuclease (patch repair protein)